MRALEAQKSLDPSIINLSTSRVVMKFNFGLNAVGSELV